MPFGAMARVLALVAGAALYALALPPFDVAAFGWLALVPLLLAVRGRRPQWALGYGVLYGYACSASVAGSWFVPALGRFFATGRLAAFALASIYGLLFWGSAFGLFAGAAAMLFRRPPSAARRLQLAALWVATELLRGRILGQPWGLLGYTQHAHVALVQVAAVTGVYGLSFLMVLVGSSVADALVLLHAHRGRAAVRAIVPPLALLAAMWLAGAAVLLGGPAGGFGGHTIAVVQTNVAPERDWTRAYTDRQLAAHLRATEALVAHAHPALVVWPEHAVPRYLEAEPGLAATLGALAARIDADLLFGAPRYEAGHTYNSARLVTAAGRNGGTYDKQRLVLLAEENPFRRDAGAPSDDPHQFSRGDGPGVLRSFVPIGLSICHEVLFPELVGESVAAGAALLVNVSNDGWLDGGHGVASRQHFAMATLRAVETRRYLVRAATTGVSGVVDPYGRVVGVIAPGATGALTAAVAGRTTVTPYVRFGDLFAILCTLSAALALVARRPALALHPKLSAARHAAPSFGGSGPAR